MRRLFGSLPGSLWSHQEFVEVQQDIADEYPACKFHWLNALWEFADRAKKSG